MAQDDVYRKAKKKIEARIGFFIHLTVYCLVNLFLITRNLLLGHETIWSIYPLAGWGLGLFMHGLAVFTFSRLETIKERMIQKEISKQG